MQGRHVEGSLQTKDTLISTDTRPARPSLIHKTKQVFFLTGGGDANGRGDLLTQDVRGSVHLAHISEDARSQTQTVEGRPGKTTTMSTEGDDDTTYAT